MHLPAWKRITTVNGLIDFLGALIQSPAGG